MAEKGKNISINAHSLADIFFSPTQQRYIAKIPETPTSSFDREKEMAFLNTVFEDNDLTKRKEKLVPGW